MKKFVYSLLLAAFFVMVSPVWSQNEDVPNSEIYIQSPNAGTVGSRYNVEIIANMTQEVFGFEFQVAYDPSILRPILRPDPNSGNEPDTEVPAPVSEAFNNAARAINLIAEDGLIDVGYALQGQPNGVLGEQILVTISFEVLAEGNPALEIQNPSLYGRGEGDFDVAAIPLSRFEEPIDVAMVGEGTLVPTPMPTQTPRPTQPPRPTPPNGGGTPWIPIIIGGVFLVLLVFVFAFWLGSRKK